MSHVESFGVRNLRSFGQKKQLIPIKKINVFVGKNSCGKSTFLRTYPLLRQSVESKTRSPILWYGAYVDFGDLSTAVHDGSDEIFFDFRTILDLKTSNAESIVVEGTVYRNFVGDAHIAKPKNTSFKADISVGLKNSRDNQVISSVCLRVENTEITMSYSGGAVNSLTTKQFSTIDKDEIIFRDKYNDFKFAMKGNLIPSKVYGTREGVDFEEKKTIYLDEKVIKNFVEKQLSSYLKSFSLASEKTIQSKLNQLYLSCPKEVLSALINIYPNDKKLQANLIEKGEEISNKCFYLLTIRHFDSFLEVADKTFKELFSSVRYLGPVRASAERFYRHQDLEIGEVDHKGENLPMVINSLDSRMKKQLSNWISQNFGFDLELEASGLHYALKIKEDNDSKFHNISDMGFGYSQILPVIVSIWLETISNKTGRKTRFEFGTISRTLVIEQPELHLHPALQYKFGLAIAKVVSLAATSDFRLVIETHSSQMIEALGESVRSNIINESDINITLFEKIEDDSTEISFSGFDAEGYLLNWPAGFLSA